MRHRLLTFLAFLPLCAHCPALEASDKAELFPVPVLVEQGHLEVSELHKIFYICLGNPEGKPVMALHGGPGAGSYPRLAQYFDPEKYFIVLHDQRGSGQSVPKGELRENTTKNLVEDIEKLRQYLNLDEMLVFGGSWGSTLALTYAEAYPENVAGMILRGVFLGTTEELEYHYLGNRFFFPKEYYDLLHTLPDRERGAHPDYLHEIITGEDKDLANQAKRALASYELKFMKLHMKDEVVASYVEKMLASDDNSMQSIDLHYVKNRYFLKENQILDDISKLSGIPITIINGRYDMAAPPLSAYRVHQALPSSQLLIVEEAGHSESEEGITAALIKVCAEFE
ncbi:MAG: prolyl aminopeptidase [bacterium]|nr:prolyl aminopeptidase [bacterium]